GDARARLVVPQGVYVVALDLPASEKRYLGGVIGAEGTLEEGDVFRVRDGETHTIDDALPLAASIAGQVLTPDGDPLKNAVVSVSADPRDNGGTRLFTRGEVIADAGGRFIVAGLAPGAYRLLVEPPNQPQGGDGRVLMPTYYPSRV